MIPSRHFSKSFNRLAFHFLLGKLQKVKGNMPNDGHNLRRIVLPDSGLILSKRHIQNPVQAILNSPVTSNCRQDFFR